MGSARSETSRSLKPLPSTTAALLVGQLGERLAQPIGAVGHVDHVGRVPFGMRRRQSEQVIRVKGSRLANSGGIDGQISRNRQQPGDDAAPPRVEQSGATPGPQHCFLGDILGGAGFTQDSERAPEHSAPKAFDECGGCFRV